MRAMSFAIFIVVILGEVGEESSAYCFLVNSVFFLLKLRLRAAFKIRVIYKNTSIDDIGAGTFSCAIVEYESVVSRPIVRETTNAPGCLFLIEWVVRLHFIVW